MKIKALLIASIATIITIVGAYWLYNRYFQEQEYALRSLVPADAVLVYSSVRPELAWDSLKQHPLGELLKDFPAMKRIGEYETELQRLLPSYEQLKHREFLFSLHITERHDFDYLLLMPLGGNQDQQLLEELRKQIEDSPDNYRLNDRVYQEVRITDIRDLKGGRTFSFFVKNGVLAGSFTSFLTEAAIRRMAEINDADDPVPVWLKEGNVTTIAESLGNLSLNLQQLPALLRVFSGNDSLVQEILPRMPYYSKLDVVTAPEGLLLNGFTQPLQPAEPDFLWALHGQAPQPMRLDYLVPVRSASLLFVGLSDPQQWHRQLRTYWEGRAPEQWERWQVLEARMPEAPRLLPMIGNEIGMATIPTLGAAKPDRLLFVQLADSGAAASLLQDMVKRLELKDSLSLYSEQFMRHALQELPYNEFPAALLGSAYLGFNESFYTFFEDYLVISSSIPALKEMLQDVQAEENWRRSVRLNRFLSRLDAEQNYGLYLNTQALWPMLYRRLAPTWKTFWDKHGTALRQIDLLSLQLSSAEGAFYTNLFMHLDPRPESNLEQLALVKKSSISLPSPIVHAPVPVPYRLQRAGYWLVQDSAQSLYLLNNAGEVVHKAKLGGYWQKQVREVDPQKNKSAHYFLSTPDSAYLLQPDLKSVKPFPIGLPGSEKIQWTSVLDYDGSRRYRFMLASAKGDLYMYDLDGVSLEGWQPKSLQGPLSAPPGHVRVRSKDIVYAFQQKGTVHAFTRRGEELAGFPLNLQDSLLGPVHIRQGSDFAGTRFITVTASGLLYEWDLQGKVVSRKQLYRPDTRARFYLVPDNKGKRFLIVEQDRFRLRLLDENGSELFEKEYLGAGPAGGSQIRVQYFSFSDAAALVAITDPEQEFAYLYDLKGSLLQTQPLNSCCPLGLQVTVAGDSLRLMKGYNNTVDQYMLPVINTSIKNSL